MQSHLNSAYKPPLLSRWLCHSPFRRQYESFLSAWHCHCRWAEGLGGGYRELDVVNWFRIKLQTELIWNGLQLDNATTWAKNPSRGELCQYTFKVTLSPHSMNRKLKTWGRVCLIPCQFAMLQEQCSLLLAHLKTTTLTFVKIWRLFLIFMYHMVIPVSTEVH